MIESFLAEIEASFIRVAIDFAGREWLNSVPNQPGWYLIETSAPLETIRGVGRPRGGAHYNLPARIKRSAALIDRGLAIVQAEGRPWVVYSGHAKNLRSRAREHVSGHAKTACLGLSNYPTLLAYSWAIYYSPLKPPDITAVAGEPIRIFGEQAWRMRHGWPVLCIE